MSEEEHAYKMAGAEYMKELEDAGLEVDVLTYILLFIAHGVKTYNCDFNKMIDALECRISEVYNKSLLAISGDK